MDKKHRNKNKQEIKSETLRTILGVCDKVNKNLPVEYQIKEIYDWCITNFQYDFLSKENQEKKLGLVLDENNIDRLMRENIGTCRQFTEAFCLMCTQVKGVKSFYVKTDAKSKGKDLGEDHPLCLLEVNGKKSFVDVSCGLGAVLRKEKPYEFLLKSWEDLQSTYYLKRNMVIRPKQIMSVEYKNINDYYDRFKDIDTENFETLSKKTLNSTSTMNIKKAKREIFEEYAKPMCLS